MEKFLKDNKSNGRIYTPNYIVKNIFDSCNYNNIEILEKHIANNSCGDGAFLVEVVERYCEFAQTAGKTSKEISMEAQTLRNNRRKN